MNLFRTAATQSAATPRPATSRRIRGAATAGLLAACALTTLSAAGPAFAEGRDATTRPEPSVSVPSEREPSAVPTLPGRDSSGRDATQPPSSSRPSAEPTQPPGGERSSGTPSAVPSVTHPGSERGSETGERGRDATPAPATGRDGSGKDELAHTGASETTTLLMGAGAAALLAAGGGTLYAVRRNRA